MTTLVEHAQRELLLANIEPTIMAKILHVVEAFETSSIEQRDREYVLTILNEVLRWKNVSPPTDDPAEWVFVGGEVMGVQPGLWQNIRRTEAFSHNAGRTYFLLSDKATTHESIRTLVREEADEAAAQQ